MKKWIVPCNTKNYDIQKNLKDSNIVYFKKNRKLEVGDIVYIYLAKPYAEIRYRGKVLNDNISAEKVKDLVQISNTQDKNFIEIEIDAVFSEGTLKYNELVKHDLRQVVNQQIISGELEEYIESKKN